MITLIFFAFIAGVATALSPCILPILPFVLSVSTSRSRSRPFFLVVGFVTTFCLFTLFVSQLFALLGIAPATVRILAITLIISFGVTMIVPRLGNVLNTFLSRFSRFAPNQEKEGVLGGLLMGASLGLVWAPCAGPIFGAIAALIATQVISLSVVLMLLAYAIGAGTPLLMIAYGGQSIIQKIPTVSKKTEQIRAGFGVATIVVGALMIFQVDTFISAKLAEYIPSSITKKFESFEQSDAVAENLQKLQGQDSSDSSSTPKMDLPDLGAAPELAGLGKWYNSQPLTLQALRGKVVLIDFWTYSCINCVRTLPYIKEWNRKYADKGLVIIGIHSPEFAFEKDEANVQRAITQNGIEYPVALDSDFKTWRAFKNQYWPAHYLIDANGQIRHTHFGEGKYEESEAAIQQLLKEAGSSVKNEKVASVGVVTTNSLREESPETYVGTARQERFVGGSAPVLAAKEYTLASRIPLHNFSAGGIWSFNPEYGVTKGNDSTLAFHFAAKDVFAVLDGKEGSSVKIAVTDAERKSLLSEKVIPLNGSQLYHLVNLISPQEGTATIQFSNPDIKIYAFTFGSS